MTTTGITPESELKADYERNTEKAINNKIKAAMRQNVTVNITGGGNVYTFNTGTYEYVKRYLPNLHNKHKSYYAKTRYHIEQNKNLIYNYYANYSHQGG
jgi:hypothetical protein